MTGTAQRVEQLLGLGVISTTPVAGGDVCTTTRLRLSDGRNAAVKTRPHAPAGFFDIEAEGLRWLAAGGGPVPEVLASADDCLVLEWIEPGKANSEAAERFGRELAALHATGAETFGAARDGFIGTAPLPNRPPTQQGRHAWAEFYASRRVLPYLKAAVDRAAMLPEEAAAVEEVVRRLPEFAGPAEPPARLHGDLWSGNVIWGVDGQVRLIDPAAHGGHRETDLAMLALFGLPHLQRVLDAYDEAAPLAEGWRDRVAVHQLHPLLVHAVLFGGSYGPRAAEAARSVL